MARRTDCDVIEVESGNAGMLMVLAASDGRATVVVLEMAPAEWRGGNTRFTGGGFRGAFTYASDVVARPMPQVPKSQAEDFVIGDYNKDGFYDDVERVTEGRS